MCSITGVGERLHNVLGQIDLGKLDSGERSLPFGLLVSGFNYHLLVIKIQISWLREPTTTEINSSTPAQKSLDEWLIKPLSFGEIKK